MFEIVDLADLLELAQSGDTGAMEILIGRYEPLMQRLSWSNGVFHEDCKQQLTVKFIMTVLRFDMDRDNGSFRPTA